MELWTSIFNWFREILFGFSNIADALNFEYGIGTYTFTLFSIVTIGGLLTYLGIAIVRWVL